MRIHVTGLGCDRIVDLREKDTLNIEVNIEGHTIGYIRIDALSSNGPENKLIPDRGYCG